MAGPLLVGAEGVVLVPGKGAYASSRPLPEGLELVMMLKHFPTSSTHLMVGTEDLDSAGHFIKIHGLKEVGVVGITPEDRVVEPATAQWNIVQRHRSRGPVNLVLTAYREVYERCISTRQAVLLYGRLGVVGTLDTGQPWQDLHERIIQARDAAVEEPDVEDE